MKIEKNVLLGGIGSILGGFVGALPWLLAYAFGNVMVGLLSMFIALGSYYGFKLTKNKIDKRFPKAVYVSTIIVVTVSLLLIMPITSQLLHGYSISFAWFTEMFKNWNLFSGFLFNYIVSIGMAFIGAIGVVATVNKKEYEKKTYGETKLKDIFGYKSVSAEELQKIKDTFNKNNAMTKENAIEKEKIIAELSENMVEARAIQIFNLICDQQIIRKYKGKYYFSEKAQNDEFYRNSKILMISLIASTVVIAVMVGFMIMLNSRNQDNTKNNANEQPKTIVEIRENEHIIGNTGIKFIPKEGLMILTDSEKGKYKDIIEYEFIAMNQNHTKMLYCMVDDGSSIEGDLSAKEYLQQAFTEEYRTDITDITVADLEFQKTSLKMEETKELYTVDCYITKIDGKFLCFNYWYPKTEQDDFSSMFEKVDVNK